jgi:ATP-dependent helicase HrpA
MGSNPDYIFSPDRIVNSSSTSLLAAIDGCLIADRHRLRRRLQQAGPAGMAKLAAEIEASRQKAEQRRVNLPVPTYPDELPVSERRDEILAAIKANQVVIVAGETGSGKTTQLPKICLEAGRGVAGLIGHTQPRRIAARSVATRIATELQSEPGHAVGYKVRFSDHIRPESYIKLMTDGILLAESQGDRFLNQYDTLIIDEAHERSLNIDFLLGYLKQLLPKRPELKLIITSATIDTERFSRHFDDAPIIEVSGRTWPVDVHYRPLGGEDEEEQDRDLQQAIRDAVDEVARQGQGDVLIFLPGEREIRETAENLRKHHPPHTEILPLYARLSVSEQNRIFQSHKGRRIVLATNVAETSLTVPGIRYVIDPGLARMSRYSHRTKVQRLPIEKISRASANQRAGRCGRVGPGVCIRLYAEEDFKLRPEFTDPEIKRSNLAAVILQMKSLRLGDIERFPFVDAPEGRMIGDGYKLLEELGAVDEKRRLTNIGKQLARLPLDPRVARMVLAAKGENSLAEVLVIASAVSVQEPRERPHDRQQAADEKHKAFLDERSDFLCYLNLWREWHKQGQHLSNNKLRRWCRDNFISYLRMREWHDVFVQLKSIVSELGWRPNEQPADYSEIHRALLAGLLGNVANKCEKQEYSGARSIKLHVFPGSTLFKKQPKWIMAAELVETARMYARTVAQIEPEWIEKMAGDLCRRSYFEPHWEKKAAAVMAYERLTLYGLVINPKRKVHYGRINPQEARELFIRGALVEGDFHNRGEFCKHNRHMIEEIEALEAKSRRRDLLVDEQVLFDFYDKRIPAGICDGRSFEQWRKQAEQQQPKLLFLKREDLMLHGAGNVTEAQFPDSLQLDGMTLQLSYHFEPGHDEDGVTLTIPLPALNLLQPYRFEWLVPGLLHEKVCQLLKSLPKVLRRNFVPVPNFADACLQVLAPSEVSLLEALQQQLFKMTGVKVAASDWDLSKLTPHMLMNFKVVDDNGKVIAMGRDLLQLQNRLKGKAQKSFAAVPVWDGEREDITEWDFGDLAEMIEFERNGVQLRGFPALIDGKDGIALRLRDTAEQAQHETSIALRRLVAFALPDKIKYLNKNLPDLKQFCLYYAPTGQCNELLQDIVDTVIDQAFFSQGELPRTQQQFQAALEQGKSRLMVTANELSSLLLEVLAEYHQLNKKLKGTLSPSTLQAAADIREQLKHLVYPGFVNQTPIEWLREYPRYFKAISKRLEKLPAAAARDRQHMMEINPLWQDYLERKAAKEQRGVMDATLERCRWMIEELRVSLFAQELRTRMPVSVQRIRKQFGDMN